MFYRAGIFYYFEFKNSNIDQTDFGSFIGEQ